VKELLRWVLRDHATQTYLDGRLLVRICLDRDEELEDIAWCLEENGFLEQDYHGLLLKGSFPEGMSEYLTRKGLDLMGFGPEYIGIDECELA
jgi:hypothetical protein